MAAIIAPGVVRYTVNGLYLGQPIANIIDMDIETTGSIVSRQDAVEAQAGILINEWSDSILPQLSALYSATSVSWVDLDSLAGSTGERQSTDQETWPQAGGIAGEAAPGNVAWRINKNTVPTRGQRQGRMYLVGVIDAATATGNPNQADSTRRATFNTALSAFLGDINQEDDGTGDYTSSMVVVHTVGGAYESHSEVTALVADSRFGSQRRRLDL